MIVSIVGHDFNSYAKLFTICNSRPSRTPDNHGFNFRNTRHRRMYRYVQNVSGLACFQITAEDSNQPVGTVIDGTCNFLNDAIGNQLFNFLIDVD